MAWKWPDKLRVLIGSGVSAWALVFSIVGAAGVLAGPKAVAVEGRASRSKARLIYYKGRNFRIPITLPTTAEGKDRIKEVSLLVSEDSGLKWRAVSKTFPDHPTFSFRSTHDGEYWFAVQILTVDGRFSPSLDSTIEPSLKVVVDTRPPELVLEPEERRGSTASVRWEVKDRYLDESALALEYQVEGAGTWGQVPLRRPIRLIGSQRWNAGTAAAIKVRMSASDRAGNVTTETLDLPEGTAERPVAVMDEPSDPGPPPVVEPISRVRSPQIHAGRDFTPVGEELDERPPSRLAARRPSDLNARSDPVGDVRSEGRGGDRPRPRQHDWGGDLNLPPEHAASASRADALEDSVGAARGQRPSFAGRPSNSRPDADGFVAMAGPRDRGLSTAPDRSSARDRNRDREGAYGEAGDRGAGPRVSNRSNDARPSTLVVKSPRFPLHYAVDDAGTNGPASVELWITQDGGRTWIRRGDDPDRASPINVDLGGEGTYGLCLVARSASGLGDRPPAPGDPPQTWVEVDLAAPTVQLEPIRIGTGTNTGKIAIDWRATDLHLEPRAVSLFWRPDEPGAAWQPLAEGQENSGQYIWTVPPNVPARFHVRIEAVDSVGHRGVAESTDFGPIIVDRSRPHSRIIGLDPNARAGADRPMR